MIIVSIWVWYLCVCAEVFNVEMSRTECYRTGGAISRYCNYVIRSTASIPVIKSMPCVIQIIDIRSVIGFRFMLDIQMS